MTTISFHLPTNIPERIRNPIRIHLQAIMKSISAVKPQRMIDTIPNKELSSEQQIILAIGKNAAAHAWALALRFKNKPLRIYVIQAKGYTNIEDKYKNDWDYWEVEHPIPSRINFEATKSILDKMDKLDSNVVFHIIVTGGASACFALPEPEIGEDYYIEIVKKALSFGFSISTLNYIRSLIDQIKGGKLAVRYRDHKILTWCVSDVIGDDPSIIGSGPTVARTKLIPRIDDLLQHIFLPDQHELITKLKDRLTLPQEIINLSPNNYSATVITKRQDLIDTLLHRLNKSDYQAITANNSLQGDITDVCEEMISVIEEYRQNSKTTIVWSGEPEIDIPVSSLIQGKGGRISALLSLLAEKIHHIDNVVLIGLATDGVDGSSPSSGYFVTSETAEHIRPLGGAHKIINKGNSGKILTSLGYGIELGNTDINLLDLYLAIII